MRVTQIIAEEKIDEAPVSGIKQGLRKMGAKALAKVGAKDAAAGIASKVDTGDQANKLYTAWRRHIGSMEKGKNQVDASEFIGWMKQNKLPVTKVPQTGVLKDKQIQQLIKQAVIDSKSLAGTDSQTSQPQTTQPNQNTQNTTQQTPTVDKNKDGKDDNTGKPVKPQPNDQSQNPNNVNTPAKITPEIQKQLDALTPEQAKELAKML